LFQAEDGIRERNVTGVQTCALPISNKKQEWYDFFTGESYQGGQTFADLPAPLWKLPIFIKKGSILPFTKASNHPNEITYDRRQRSEERRVGKERRSL